MTGKNTLAALALAGAAIVAALGHDGWGWFLFVAVLLLA
jgi:hypothetical protein